MLSISGKLRTDGGLIVLFYLPPWMYMQVISVIGPVVIFLMVYIRRRNVYDLHHAILGNFIFFQGQCVHCHCLFCYSAHCIGQRSNSARCITA
jgi:hypothetical protein